VSVQCYFTVNPYLQKLNTCVIVFCYQNFIIFQIRNFLSSNSVIIFSNFLFSSLLKNRNLPPPPPSLHCKLPLTTEICSSSIYSAPRPIRPTPSLYPFQIKKLQLFKCKNLTEATRRFKLF